MKKLLLAVLVVLALVSTATDAGATFVVSRVTVATTVGGTLLYTSPSRGSTLLIRNAGAAAVFIGPSGVTTANGFEVPVGSAVSLILLPKDTVYGIVAAATERVDMIEGPTR